MLEVVPKESLVWSLFWGLPLLVTSTKKSLKIYICVNGKTTVADAGHSRFSAETPHRIFLLELRSIFKNLSKKLVSFLLYYESSLGVYLFTCWAFLISCSGAPSQQDPSYLMLCPGWYQHSRGHGCSCCSCLGKLRRPQWEERGRWNLFMMPWPRSLPPLPSSSLPRKGHWGAKNWDPPDGDKKASQGTAKSHPRLLKCVVKGVGVAWQVDLTKWVC